MKPRRMARCWAEAEQRIASLWKRRHEPRPQIHSREAAPETWIAFDIAEPEFVFKMGRARALLPANDSRGALSPLGLQRVLSILQRIVMRAELEWAFFCDRSGALLAQYQRSYHTALQHEHVLRITTAAANQMTASEKIARWLGENKPFHSCFEEGAEQRLWLHRIGRGYILIVSAAPGVSPGLVRIYAQRAVASLEEIFIGRREFEAKNARSDLFWSSSAAPPKKHVIQKESF